MGDRFKFDLLDLSGGHVDGLPATHLENTQFPLLVNFYTYGPKIVRRRGTKRITTQEHSEILTTVFTYKNTADEYQVIAGTLTGIVVLDGTTLDVVPQTFILAEEETPWHFKQFLDTIYATRKNSGTLMRGTPDGFTRAGIDAPTTAPTLADGAAGAILAGGYYGVVVFKNSDTGQRSNPGPASALYTAPGSKKIDWSNIPVSTNTQVNAREIYRTPRNQTGVYYLVATINDNSTTTYTGDNDLMDNLGRKAEFNLDPPPNNLEVHEVWLERIFASDGDAVYYTPRFSPESFPAAYTIELNSDDGHRVRALHAVSENRLIVGKTRGIYFLTPAGENKFSVRTLDDKRGVIASASMKSAEGLLFWYDGEDFLKSDGGPGVPMADFKIRRILDDIPDDLKERVTATIYPKLHWYVATVPQSTGVWKMLVYSYRDDSWGIFEFPQNATFIGDFFEEDYEHLLYGLFSDGHLYEVMRQGYQFDWGMPISMRWLTKAFDGGRPGLQLAVDTVRLLCSSIPHAEDEASLALYRNGITSSSVRERDIYLYAPTKQWKSYRIRGQAYPGDTIQIGFESIAAHDFEVYGIVIEGALVDRFARPM